MEISARSRPNARRAAALGDGLKDFAQQRRHDLENSYPLARYLLHEERGVPRLFVGTDMDSRAYHEGRKKLPDGDDEALGRCLSDHVRGRQFEVGDLGKEVVEHAPLLNHGPFWNAVEPGIDQRTPNSRAPGRSAGAWDLGDCRIELFEIRTRGRSPRRNPDSVSLQRRRTVLRGEYDARAAVSDDLCQPCGGIVGSSGRNAPPARCTAIIAAKKSMPRSVNKTTTSSRQTSSRQSRPAMAEARLESSR